MEEAVDFLSGKAKLDWTTDGKGAWYAIIGKARVDYLVDDGSIEWALPHYYDYSRRNMMFRPDGSMKIAPGQKSAAVRKVRATLTKKMHEALQRDPTGRHLKGIGGFIAGMF